MILVLGATGFLGKRVCHKLEEKGLQFYKSSKSLGVDLRNASETMALFEKVKPEFVLNCSAYVGGIGFGQKHPAEMFYNNLSMTLNILEACKQFHVSRLVNPIANCAYPARATFFKEDEFWDGALHESVMVYGFARKASWMGAYAYANQYGLDSINLILSNMYGPEDHFEEERSHALGALIMKIVQAKENKESPVSVWGSGNPVREWLYVDDGAEAMIRSLQIAPYIDPINIGVGKGVSIKELAEELKKIIGYQGDFNYDLTKPDGAMYKTVDGERGRKLLDWSPETTFEEGLKNTVEWYLKHKEEYHA